MVIVGRFNFCCGYCKKVFRTKMIGCCKKVLLKEIALVVVRRFFKTNLLVVVRSFLKLIFGCCKKFF